MKVSRRLTRSRSTFELGLTKKKNVGATFSLFTVFGIKRFHLRGQRLCQFEQKKVFVYEKSSTATGLVWHTNMAAVLSCWQTNMAGVTSRENNLIVLNSNRSFH